MQFVPSTNIRTSHALTISANGIPVGLINGWNPDQGRGAVPIFELDPDNSGNPVEVMPGNITGLTIQVSRFDTYKIRMEEAFGTPDLIMLTRQNQPFQIIETWIIPPLVEATEADYTKEKIIYTGCWFTRLGRSVRADDNRIVNVNATLIYTKRLKVSGPVASWLKI